MQTTLMHLYEFATEWERVEFLIRIKTGFGTRIGIEIRVKLRFRFSQSLPTT